MSVPDIRGLLIKWYIINSCILGTHELFDILNDTEV